MRCCKGKKRIFKAVKTGYSVSSKKIKRLVLLNR